MQENKSFDPEERVAFNPMKRQFSIQWIVIVFRSNEEAVSDPMNGDCLSIQGASCFLIHICKISIRKIKMQDLGVEPRSFDLVRIGLLRLDLQDKR